MPITATDLKFKLSVNTSPGNANAQANPNDSIGGYMSSTELVDATLNNLFDDVTGDENAASDVEYRCMFIHNDHATLALQSPKIWISSEVAGGASVAIALDGTGVTPEAQSGTPQAERIANESTAPSGESFSAPTTKETGLAPANLTANSCLGLWVRRTAANSAALNNDGATIRVEGDTAA